ncbi:MAG: toll/interleukin-1 receptor domain-containing protein, partial [bacterium]|nr:toll/interleukin-1 receptor domain-containing protein [bacterium]
MSKIFISYTGKDSQWAEWMAWVLEEEGHTAVLQAWDFRPGSNFVLQMQKAVKESDRTIAVISPGYLDSAYTNPEWAVAFALDPKGDTGKLLPVRIEDCFLLPDPFLQKKDFHHAWTDLNETLEIAQMGEMKLHLVDYHLEAARV